MPQVTTPPSPQPQAPQSRRRLWWGIGVAVVVIIGLLAYLIWSGMSARNHLNQARTHAKAVQQSLAAGDTQAAHSALGQFSDHVDTARSRVSGPIWASAAHVPYFGENAKTVRLVTFQAARIGTEADALLTHVGQGDLLAELAPHDGAINLDLITDLTPPLGQLDTTLAQATSKFADVNTQRLLAPIRGAFDQLSGQVLDAGRIIAHAHVATQLLPDMLGAEAAQHYLLRFENNAEVRTTGGMPGAWALLRAKSGKIKIVEQGSVHDFPRFEKPVAPLSDIEKELWGVQAGIYLQDTNFIPHFPRSAELTNLMWQARETQLDHDRGPIELDGIIEVDAFTLSYLLEATGPVTVPDTDIELTTANVVDELLHDTYVRHPGKVEQDMFFAAAAAAVFDALSAGVKSPTALMHALSQSVTEHRLRIHSFHPDTQAHLAGTAIAGEMNYAADAPPQLAVYLNDGTASKLSYYTTTNLATEAVTCEAEAVTYRSTVTMDQADFDLADVPRYVLGYSAGRPDEGQQWVTLTIYGPAGAEFSDPIIDGEQVAANVYDDTGRPVMVTAVLLQPGSHNTIAWDLTVPNPSAELHQRMTPGLTPIQYPATVAPTCAK